MTRSSKLSIVQLLTTLILLFDIKYAAAYLSTEMYQASTVLMIHNETDFNKLHQSIPYMLVHFMEPWSGHDMVLIPEFINASRTLKDEHPSVYQRARLAVVDCFTNDGHKISFCSDCSGFPTIKFYTPVGIFPFSGERRAHKIVEFVVRHIPSAPYAIVSQHHAQVFLGSFNQNDADQPLHPSDSQPLPHEVGILGVFHVTDSVLIERFVNASVLMNVTAHDHNSRYRFAITSNTSFFEDFYFPFRSITVFTVATNPSTYVEDFYLESAQSMGKIIRWREKWSQKLKQRQTTCSDWSSVICHYEHCIDRHPGKDFSRHKPANSMTWMNTVVTSARKFLCSADSHELLEINNEILFDD